MLNDRRMLEFLVVKACMAASRVILEIYQTPFEVLTKSDESPVTQADISSDNLIREILASSQIPVISEEVISKFKNSDTPLFWCVDPLDGTREFVNKTGEFAINIALIENGEPIFGAICSPIQSTIWYTSSDGIMKYNFAKHHVDAINSNSITDTFHLVYGTFSEEAKKKYQKLIDTLNSEFKIESKKVGSAVKFGLLAEGKADAYIRTGKTSIWDIAAGHALLNMAGGSLINLETGEEMEYSLDNLSNPPFMAYTSRAKVLFDFLSNKNLFNDKG